MMKALFILTGALSLTLALQAQNCSGGGPASALTLNLSGLVSYDYYDDDNNVRGTLTAAFPGQVVAVAAENINYNTVGGSLCSDPAIDIAAMRNTSSNYFEIYPSDEEVVGPCSGLPFTQFFDLVALGDNFPTGPGNSVYYELWEWTDHNPDAADATYTSGTVTIYVCPLGQVLPLKLKSFSGLAGPEVNTLNWQTLSEKNVQFHIVERSIDGIRWSEIGRLQSQGDSKSQQEYVLEDRKPLVKAQYRLRSLDFNGLDNYSNTIVLSRKGRDFEISHISPNPATELVQVQFNALQDEAVQLKVRDISGKLVLEQSLDAVSGVNEFGLAIGDLQAGIYSLSLGTVTELTQAMRFVKQ